MKKEKDFYTSPEVDVLELRTEGVICESVLGDSDFGDSGLPGPQFPIDDLGTFGLL